MWICKYIPTYIMYGDTFIDTCVFQYTNSVEVQLTKKQTLLKA